jgi:hypothetical protein
MTGLSFSAVEFLLVQTFTVKQSSLLSWSSPPRDCKKTGNPLVEFAALTLRPAPEKPPTSFCGQILPVDNPFKGFPTP